jgi:beta-glucosidase-like glycosyl hydrolase
VSAVVRQMFSGLIVGSYNKINGTWACENEGIINKLMKDELGFRGYMMSDWNGQKSSESHCALLELTQLKLNILQLAALMRDLI